MGRVAWYSRRMSSKNRRERIVRLTQTGKARHGQLPPLRTEELELMHAPQAACSKLALPLILEAKVKHNGLHGKKSDQTHASNDQDVVSKVQRDRLPPEAPMPGLMFRPRPPRLTSSRRMAIKRHASYRGISQRKPAEEVNCSSSSRSQSCLHSFISLLHHRPSLSREVPCRDRRIVATGRRSSECQNKNWPVCLPSIRTLYVFYVLLPPLTSHLSLSHC